MIARFKRTGAAAALARRSYVLDTAAFAALEAERKAVCNAEAQRDGDQREEGGDRNGEVLPRDVAQVRHHE